MFSKEPPKPSSGNVASRPMREAFLQRLCLCAAFAFLGSLLVSIILEDHSCRREIKREINSRIAENNESVQSARSTADLFVNANDINARIDVSVVAKLVANEPSILTTDGRLEEIAKKLHFSEVYFITSEGVIDASWPEDCVGVNILKNEDYKGLRKVFETPIPRVAPRVNVHFNESDYHASEFEVAAIRSDRDGVVIVRLHDLFTLSAEQIATASRPLDVPISHSGRLYFFSKFPKNNLGQPIDPREVSGCDDFPDLETLPNNLTTIKIFNHHVFYVYAQRTFEGIYVGWIPYRGLLSSKLFELTLICFCNFVVFLAIFSLVSLFIQKLFVDSIYAVNRSLDKITAGNLNEKVKVSASKEFVELSEGVNTTVDSLKEAAAEVKRRSDEELTLAGNIQLASLPRLENIYTRHQIFDVYAEARLHAGVGGDMYDFFFVDDYNVMFYIADVSGRGVAASLVMMKTMTLVKNFALLGFDLETIVTNVNQHLTENKESIFVSGIFFELNLRSGDLKYVNAGHVPPFIRRKSCNFTIGKPERQLALGLMPDQTYESSSLEFHPGDELLIYTDGFMNSLQTTLDEFFKKSHVLEVLDSHSSEASSQQYVKAFFDVILNGRIDSQALDDVTALCFRFIAYKVEKERRSSDKDEKNPSLATSEVDIQDTSVSTP